MSYFFILKYNSYNKLYIITTQYYSIENFKETDLPSINIEINSTCKIYFLLHPILFNQK